MKNQKSAQTLRKRKFLMVLPLLIIPFVSMAFWALDGGKGSQVVELPDQKKGFNLELPQAKFDVNEKQDKFSVYEESARQHKGKALIMDEGYNPMAFSNYVDNPADQNEQKINERLSQINAEINRQGSSVSNSSSPNYVKTNSSENMSGDVNRLENMMESLNNSDGDEMEMAKLNAVLEKILDIQHPGRAREKMTNKQSNELGNSMIVQVVNGKDDESLFKLASRGVYNDEKGNAIQATVHQNQDIVSGSVVKLRLLDSVRVNGILIPNNEFIYGIASVDEERLKINIATLRYKNSILPVSLSAYDLDGLEGLYIPGAITRDASKKGVDDAIQSLQIITMDPSVSAQVAGAGITAAKGLFGRKVKQVRVKVKAGYQLLLRDNNLRNH
ncbi:MAG: conjugative transposon protein TraM [Pedobacter sp.]|nr:MAG: conjugative transposon protein TraM [Pedobacter sp.]